MKEFVTVQDDWNSVIADADKREGEFWVSCYGEGRSVHAKVMVQGDTVQSSDGIKVELTYKDTQATRMPVLKVDCEELGVQGVLVHGCMRSFTPFLGKEVLALDVSPGGELYVAGGSEGKLVVGSAHTGVLRVQLQGHVGDVSACRFFPSGQVVLSAGADLTMRVWSVEDGSCPVIMRGHTRGITDVLMVERGKNVVSTSLDGTVKLWHVASATCIDTLANWSCKVNAASLDGGWPITVEHASSEQHVGILGKLVAAARGDGQVTAVDMSSRQQVFSVRTLGHDATACDLSLSHNILATGTVDGHVQLFDVRDASRHLFSYRRNDAAITHIKYHPTTNYLYISTRDGMCFKLDTTTTTTSSEFSNPGLHDIPSFILNNETIYTANEDGMVRIYYE